MTELGNTLREVAGVFSTSPTDFFMSSSSDAETMDVPGFFEVKGRSGNPTTEELHARASKPKRFNNGQAYGLRGRRAGETSTQPLSTLAQSFASPASALPETETHTVVRAGGVPAAAATAASSANRCSGSVLSHGWAFLCADGGVFAWEQGMVASERPGAAASADQACLRFDHPTMADELAAMDVLEVSVEAADLVALTHPWEASGGKRELLLVSPRGLARYWPDLRSPRRYTDVDACSVAPGQSVTRVAALGPADFLCGMSKGGVLRIRPGLAQPSLLAQSSSMFSFSTIKRVGTYIGQKTFAAAEPAAEQETAPAATAAPVVNLSVVQPPTDCGSAAAAVAPAHVLRLSTETLEIWSIARGEGGGAGAVSLEARRPLMVEVERSLGGRKACLVDLAVVGGATSFSPGGEASPRWALELLVLAVAVGGRGGGGALSVHAVRVSSGGGQWVGSSVTIKHLSSRQLPGGPAVGSSALSMPRVTLVDDKEAFFFGDGSSAVLGSWGSGSGGSATTHVLWPTPVVVEVWSMSAKITEKDCVEWEELGRAEVSSSVALLGGCIGGGAGLLGCSGIVLLSSKGQAVWVAPRTADGRAVDLEPPETSSPIAVEEWRGALLDEGLSVFEAGEAMDRARLAVEALLHGVQEGRAVAGDLDTAIVDAGVEVLNGTWRQSAAFAPPHQLVHLALREKGRRHRALVRFMMDAGAWGLASMGRAALAEGGEKIAAAARLCELQDAISRNAVGIKAARLLDHCLALALQDRAGGGREGVEAGRAEAMVPDRYFEQTQGVLDALVELHAKRPANAPSAFVHGAAVTPLQFAVGDPALGSGEGLALLNQISLVVAGVFEAALRHRASERSVYRAGTRGKIWTASSDARRVLFKQLQAYDFEKIGALKLQGAGRADVDIMCGAIGRLSTLLLDGFREEEQANPAASGKVDWQTEYVRAKRLCVRVVAACGREDLARSLADEHGDFEGTVRLCHEAEMREPGCRNGHSLLRTRMQPPPLPAGAGEVGESEDECVEREDFVRFVLNWHLKNDFKTALLDVGAAVPSMLMQFLADWREAELLWMFQIRLEDYTGAGQALLKGTPPAQPKGGRCEAQHLWLSLAKLAYLAGGEASSGDPTHGTEIQRRLELAEVRARLVKSLPEEEEASDKQPWTWHKALTKSIELVNAYAAEAPGEEAVEDAADIAYQGYKAIVAGLAEGSHEYADELWSGVIALTLNDPVIQEAVARGVMPSAAEGDTMVTDREMEAVWKRPTVLYLLRRAINKDRLRRMEAPWSGGAGGGGGDDAAKIDLADESLEAMVYELMPAAADGNGVTAEKWIAAIRKCPW